MRWMKVEDEVEVEVDVELEVEVEVEDELEVEVEVVGFVAKAAAYPLRSRFDLSISNCVSPKTSKFDLFITEKVLSVRNSTTTSLLLLFFFNS